ncbi:MAG: FAD-dependent oxidoreductase [Armatimonadota bacterium]|nr:FAD-dependent oxidoreductase [Armatimonadota bacterium]
MDWPRIRARKDAVISTVFSGVERSLQRNPRIDLIRGRARFLGPNRLEVGGREVEANKVIVASGVAPVIPSIPGLKEAGFLTNEAIMETEERILPGKDFR